MGPAAARSFVPHIGCVELGQVSVPPAELTEGPPLFRQCGQYL